MSLRADIFTALTSGSPAARVYPDVLPQMAVLPAVTFFTVTGDNDFHLQGQSGLIRRIVQVDVWSKVAMAADQLMVELENLMVASTAFQVNGIAASAADGYEPETERYRVSREFTIWAQQ